MPVCDHHGHFPWTATPSGKEARMESIAAALVTGLLTLFGVIVSNSRSRAVMEAKIDALTKQVEKHNRMVERAYAPGQDVIMKAEIESMRRDSHLN